MKNWSKFFFNQCWTGQNQYEILIMKQTKLIANRSGIKSTWNSCSTTCSIVLFFICWTFHSRIIHWQRNFRVTAIQVS